MAASPAPAAAAPPAPTSFKYTIQSGDNMWAIASKLTGSGARWKEFLPLNPTLRLVGQQVQPFMPGQVILLPIAWGGTLGS
jgi:nucleoid-associated protein YgaU